MFSVSGEANFTIERTGMTLGGFIQPGIARTLIEQPASVEKGLCQRFLWVVPEPCFDAFDQLQHVSKDFISTMGECSILFYNSPTVNDKQIIIAHLLSCLWVNGKHVRTWMLPRRPADNSEVQPSEGPSASQEDHEVQVMGCGHFQHKFDQIQTSLKQIGVMDELLSGIIIISRHV